MNFSLYRPLGFSLVSAVCLGIYNAVMIAGDAMGSSMWAALLLAYCLVVTVGYAGHSFLTFRQRMKIAGLGRYAVSMAANMPVAVLLLWIAHALLGMPMWLAAPGTTVATLALNYQLSHWAIMGRRARSSG